MAFTGTAFRHFSVFRLSIIALALAAALAPERARAQAPLRCDLQLRSTPGTGAEAACLDLVALQNGGPPIQTAGNATRISTDGFRLCKNAFGVTVPAGADIVFIYDNSGSMYSTYARVDSATGDTAFFHNSGCGQNPPVVGPFTYNTQMGPRTIQQLGPGANCSQHAGDPYLARGKAITQGIDFLAATSPNSTAGAVGFSGAISRPQPPLLVSVPGNAGIVKASVMPESLSSTYYVPPLRQATAWLDDTALTNTQKKAIVFLSDGEPTDGQAFSTWLNANLDIPIFTIALGDSGVPFTRMVDMSTRTGGRFYRVAPDNIAQMNAVMQEIIQSITVVNLPSAIEVSNGAFAPPMVSRSSGMQRNPDSSISLVLDSIIALKKGPNPLTVKITMAPGDVRTHTLNVQADGADAGSSSSTLECHPMPTLVMLNPQNALDTAYPSGPTQYDVRLTRATSDIGPVTVTATSRDTSRPGWGDTETISLPQASAQGGTTVNQRDNYPFNGGATAAPKGDNTLQAAPNGEVILTWQHPRDERERATYTLPGRKVPINPGFIFVERVVDVPKGITVSGNVKDPIVIRGGVAISKNGETAVLSHKGILHNPHSISDATLNPNNTPTFVFKTASPFSYKVSVFDHLGQFLTSQEGKVDSLRWEQMRGNADSLAVAFSLLPVSEKGQPFATGAYIMRATITTLESNRSDPGRPMRVKPVTRIVLNRFGYRR